jgi:sugar lactone lactonase YvrE
VPLSPVSIEPRLVWPVAAQLGEGPIWCADEGAVRFVDINGGRLHRFDPATGRGESIDVGGSPSFIVPAIGGGFVVGSGNALRRYDRDRLGEVVAIIDMPSHNRTNDATVDCAGRLWFGTMDDEETCATGRVHCYDRGTLRTTDWRAVVTNGPAISCDGKMLYHVDSGERTIWRIPLVDGSLASSGEVFVKIDAADGFPDGVVIDSEDCLWVSLWDGWALRRYAPDGSVLQHITLPCARVTKVAFGGHDLRTAFVTTARVGLDRAALAAQPEAGGLFAFDAPAPGRPPRAVKVA